MLAELDDYDWAEVFGEGGGGNTTPDVDSLDETPTDPVLRENVAEIIVMVNGENDGDDWVGLFRMNDGRWLAAQGGCDYTGWDCRASNNLTVASSFGRVLSDGLTPQQIIRLGRESLTQFPEYNTSLQGSVGTLADWLEDRGDARCELLRAMERHLAPQTS